MKWYKIARQSAWKTKTYPEKAVNRSLWNFYNWLKAKNVIVTFYHGTSDLAYSLIGKTGWISPPTWRGREKEEGRYSTDIHDEAEKGLDKLFFTKRFEQAGNYAERDAKTWNSNTEKVLETKKKLNIDPKIIANPLVIKIALPLHDLDEIKGNVFGTYIYNESGMDDEIKSAITSFESNDVKLKEILEVINGSYDKSNEFTVKGGLPVSRKEGFAHVSLLGVDDYVELLTKGVTSYEKIPQEIRDKYPERLAEFEEIYIVRWENFLKNNPWDYASVPQLIREKYQERFARFEERYIVGLEYNLKDNPLYYERVPQLIREKYQERFARFEERYIVELENKLKNTPWYYETIPQEIKNKYPERIEEAYLVGSENYLKKYPWYYASIPQEIKNKYPERIKEAYLVGSERLAKYAPKLANKYMNWYKLSQTKEDFVSVGETQRGAAESAMLAAQRELGGGVMQYAIEHAGDLIHRMTESPTFEYAGYPYVKEKVDKLLYLLTNPYGFTREYFENIKTNAAYAKEDYNEKRDRINIALSRYIDEHENLTAYNKAHKLAKTVAMSIADLEIPKAVAALRELSSHLGSEEEWTRFAHENLIGYNEDSQI